MPMESLNRSTNRLMTEKRKSLDLISEQTKYLSVIEDMLGLLADGGLSEDQESYLEIISENISHLKSLQKTLADSDLHSSLSAPETSASGFLSDSKASSTKPLKILLVEDDAVQRMFVSRILSRRGHTITVATNGREGLRMYVDNSFDLILMDCQMPGVDGFKLTSAIRKNELKTHHRTPIIAYTCHSVTGYKQLCFQVGMDDYVNKPSSSAELISKVEEAAWRFSQNEKTL